MKWSEQYSSSSQPSREDIAGFIGSSLWDELNEYLMAAYAVQPEMAYSNCSMQRGWNIKYKKGGKSLCTLYPMPGYFIALVVIGDKEAAETDLYIQLCSDYTQELYRKTASGYGGKWLMLEVTCEAVFQDAKGLIEIRRKPKDR